LRLRRTGSAALQARPVRSITAGAGGFCQAGVVEDRAAGVLERSDLIQTHGGRLPGERGVHGAVAQQDAALHNPGGVCSGRRVDFEKKLLKCETAAKELVRRHRERDKQEPDQDGAGGRGRLLIQIDALQSTVSGCCTVGYTTSRS